MTRPLADLLERLAEYGGDLSAAGAYDPDTISAVTNAGRSPRRLRSQLTEAGVDAEAAEDYVALTHRMRSGRGLRLHDADDLDDLPELEWLVDTVLPCASIAVLYGSSGVGKSFLAADLAASVASGEDWLGWPVRRGAVVFVAAEGTYGMRSRFTAWKKDREVRRLPRLKLILEAVNLLDPLSVTELIVRVAALKPSLIIFDTLARSLVGADENSARDIGALIDAARRITRETGACLLLIHHTGKVGTIERGSSSLRAGVDVMISCENRDGGVVAMACTKTRDAAPFQTRHVRLIEVGESLVPVVAKAPGPKDVDVSPVLRALQKVGQAVSQRQLTELIGGRAAQARATIAAAVEAGSVRREPGPRNSWLYDIDPSVDGWTESR